MCGIAGFLRPGDRRGLDGDVRSMMDALAHRGPDGEGAWTDSAAGVALGHRRLAIVELSERGAQPMHSACGRFVLTYNGEIYNHLDLRAELEASAPVPWRGTSDTETLLEGFAAWGVEATLARAVGMFAFGLWDRRDRRLTLARDRFGEKPLYYGWLGRGQATAFAFGSELKALRAHKSFANAVNRDVVALYLRFCYVPAPYSIYEDIFKLEPGTTLTLNAGAVSSRLSETRRYWSYAEAAARGVADPVRDEREGLSELKGLLTRAVRGQLMSDVPLGAFLSGGVDSSTVVALMQAMSSRPVRTFTVGFDDGAFNEAPYAAAVARRLGTEHQEIHVSPKETMAVIPKLPCLYDEPFGDSSQIPTSIICSAARKYVTVALSGDGGDELFGGYNRYVYGPMFWSLVSWAPAALRKAGGAGLFRLSPAQWNVVGRLPLLRRHVARLGDKAHKLAARLVSVEAPEDVYQSLVTEWRAGQDPALGAAVLPTRLDDRSGVEPVQAMAQRMMLLDGLTYLPDDILVKVDRAAMATSLETRVPFLDHRVAEFAWRLPMSMKINGGSTKWALRQILYQHVPKELLERPKSGFAIPVGAWIRGPLRDWAEALLDERRLGQEGYFDVAQTRRLWSEHCGGFRDWTPRLWSVLMFQAWLASLEPRSAALEEHAVG